MAKVREQKGEMKRKELRKRRPLRILNHYQKGTFYVRFTILSLQKLVHCWLAINEIDLAISVQLYSRNNLLKYTVNAVSSQATLDDVWWWLLSAVAVAVTFFVCWAPFHTQRIITSCVDDDGWTPALIELQHGLFHVSGTPVYIRFSYFIYN